MEFGLRLANRSETILMKFNSVKDRKVTADIIALSDNFPFHIHISVIILSHSITYVTEMSIVNTI